jgi:putative molybdopterin biosynthesis protein
LRDEGEIERRIQVVGSHDLSLDVLRDLMKIRHPGMDLISTHVGSVSGLVAMSKGIIDVSTTHILDEQEKVYNIQAIKKYLGGQPVTLIHLARRTQGLLVQRGNPKGIGTIEDLGRSGVTFVNRQVGSGTRILLDVLLRERGVDPRAIRGYEREEATHTAVGILVREGIADCGLAIYPIARIFGLDFVPVTEEDYDMVVTKEFTQDPRFELLMELIRGREFAERLNHLGGYTTKDTGTVKYAQG